MVNPTDPSRTEPAAATVQPTPEPSAHLFEAPTVAGIAARDPLRPLPLSFAQQRIRLAEQLDPGNPVHNVPTVLRIRGELHVPALRRALREIFQRHEVLRTAFAETGGEAVQVVHPAAWPGLPVADLAALPAAAREREALRHVRAEALRPFDLGRAPLARTLLARVDAGEWILALVLHRAVADAWSVRVLFREVEALYAAFSRGEASPLPEPAAQYADHAAWQRERPAAEVLDTHLAWWRERLEGAPPLLALPTDRPRPAAPARQGARVAREIPEELVAALRALARREGATTYVVLLAAWQVLLSRWAAQDDVVVGTPVAGRPRREMEGAVGPFADTLAVRADLSGNPRFAAHLAHVREATLGAHAHPELPLERLVEALRPERSPGYAPPFQVTFSPEDAAGLLPALPGLEVEEVDAAPEVAGFDLELRAVERGGGVRLVLRYRPDLFDAATAERMLDGYALLLGALPAGADLPVMELPLLRDEDRRRLAEWGAGPVLADAGDATVHGMFAAQAARTPGRTALAWRGESLTYAELDRHSARLARRLRESGVGPEARVGVSLERTPGLVVALLAVLRAGGAYVPLDPAYPRERLGWMLEDAGARLVLTTDALAGRLPDGAEAVCVDAAGELPGAADGAAPESGVLPENLSHVIFTSGSTGRPRGVMIRHAAVAVLVRWLRGAVTDAERSSVLFATSVSFDVSVAEVFGTLCWGGTLVLAENALELASVAEPVVHASMVPTAAAELLRSGGIPASVRTLALGGEPLPDDLARALYALGTVDQVRNLYGPTEDTTYSTWSVVPREGPVSIGRPVADTRARVLDGELRPVPPGVAGELYLAGGKLARGYAGRPDLTAERFLPDPSGAPGDRMYRVMDRARWRPDGQLEYLGRVDFQVKVRGFRVEPGEIETALRRHPAVGDAVVVARDDAPGGRGLVAYLTTAAGAAVPAAAELRAHLARGLPEHMLPAAFVALETLPLTPSGKTDRRALPAPPASAVAAAAHTAPRTPAEEALAAIWAEVLGSGPVGVHDDFFEMGGHSLLAMRVVSRARAVLGVEIPVRAVFEARTVAALAARIGAGDADAAGMPPLVRADHAGPLPLSFAQQRLWFLHRLDPGGVAYNVPAVLRLRGPLDAKALRRALAALVERHESLRTVFPVADGEPAQAVLPADGFAPAVCDLGGVPAAAREAEALRRATEVAGRPFDLEAGPLFRAALLRLDAGDHVLALAMHHVVTDGWSMGVLFRDLDALYGALARGAPSPLEPPALRYADYAAWQREWLAGATLEAQLDYWRTRLAGAPPLLDLPTDRPRPQSPRGVRGALPLLLPGALVGQLRALARGEGATLFTAVLAGFQALLSRYSGQDDVLVGTPVAGRRWAELEPLVGFFVNTLAIRADLSAGPDARSLLAQVRERVLEAQTHQDVPFERLVDELGVERSLGHSPLFQAMLTLATAAERGDPRLRGLAVEELPSPVAETPFDLGVLLEERGDGLAGEMDFRAELFEASTVARMAEHFRTLLEGMAAHPERRVAELPLLAPGERARLLEWGAGPAAPGPALPVHEAFARQAARTPAAAAVLHGDCVLTYGELDARSAGLARVLRGRGVGTDAPVGVLLEHSADAVVALLAVLRAGGCWLPLDPAAPPERIARLLHDSGAAVVVTRRRWAGLLAGTGASVVPVDATPDAADDAPLPRVHPEGAAYLIYTSGSTGRPKGVVVPHGAAAAHFAAAARAYGLTAADRGLVFASLGFDVALEQLLPPLLVGASVLLRDPDPWSPAELAARVEAHGVTVADLPAAYWAQLVLEPAAAEAVKRRLRVVSVGGEAFPPWTARTWAELPGGPSRLLNGYGPTEAVVTATLHELPAAAAEGEDVRVPIGRPVEGHTAYVLDGGGGSLPVGVPGELCLGGALARGYLGQPGATAERFVPDPFGGPGARMYRTGDRARWLASGALEFLGRIDQQVKVRGFRIEPGEVEAALERHPRVREAVVVPRGEGAGKRLVAYVAAAGDAPPAVEEVRAFARATLPEYMVPAAVVVLDALPLTATGKTDRRALPEPPAAEGGGYDAPRTPAEELVAGIFGEVLGAARVGARDNFFAMGGHSLLGTRVVARLRAALGVEVPLRALFEAQTVSALAARVEAERGGDGGAAPPPLVPVERSGPVPLAFAQERLWFLHAMEPDEVGYNMAAPVRLRGRLDAAALERAMGALVERHEPLRTTFRPVARGAVQLVHPAGPARLPVADLGRLDAVARGREAARLAQDDAARPFDLARGPVLRAALARLADDEHVLLLCMHHVVSDGWSMDVLFRDLFTLYEAFARGAPSPLPPLPVTYADFAAWQRGWLAGDALRSQLDWWRERLRGASPVLELPTDRPRPAVVSGRGAALPLAVPPATAHGLHALARREGATLYMVARAAADLLLARWSGQEDIVVGSPIANRTRVELDALVGMFVNTLALRTDLSGDPTFLELLGRVREMALGAYAHQDLPFERLVEEIAPERSLSHTPLFQAMFALQNTQGAAPPSLDELRVEEFPLETRAALFDLELELWGADGGLAGGVRFRTDLFDDATVARFAAQYLAVLAAVCAAPDERLSAIPILPAEEARQLLAFGCGSAPAGSAGRPVPVLLADQAARTPDAAAVRWDGGSLTHAELHASADRLAHRLRARGVGAGTTVAVCVERGPQVLVALLAVWKAGGVYLPLDPTHPADRLSFLLRDSGAELVVTEAAVAGSLPEFGGEIVPLDDGHDGAGDADALPDSSSPGDLAYLIYTSGSTGEPKAVAVEHGQLAHTLRGAGEVLGLRAADVVAALASVAFDISLLELLAPLLAGAAVRVVPRELLRDPEALVDAAADVTVLHAVPALMRQVVDVVRAGRELPSMRLLLVGGDSVPPELLRDVREVLPAAAARVLYGPTEGTIICATYGVPAEDPVAGHPLGRPLPGVRLAVRGPRGEICPVGVPGELWISGGGVARGYLGRPELTAERFVTVDGERACRTGDRARWRPDGVLEFLGRSDEQVKVRGFRIEPGEVEAALRAQPGVRDAVVVAREDRPGERRLVAYVVPRPAAELPGDDGSAAEQVAGWEAVFDETYGEGAAATDPTLNLTGWNSSYTGEPIPREEMREWVEHTAGRVLALRPERVLEIGCGTGLLLFRVAPRVRAYHGTDFSGVALDFVRRHLAGLPQVALAEREADRLDEYAGAGFDTVVLNSVAQYFPGVDYLLRVLEGAVAALRPGGRIFVGDVRSLPLLGAFHASVELARAAHDLPAERLRARVRRGIAEEQELLVDPALWEALRARIPRLGRVEVQAKRGGHDNEVSRFRYDVVLHLDAEPADAAEPAVREWDGEDAAGLRALAEETSSALLVRGVPDARVRAHVRALERVAGADGAATAGAVHALAAADADPGVEPETVFALAEELGRGVEARPGAPGYLDVLFHPAGGVADFPAAVDEERPWEAYANDPRWGRRRRALVPALRQAVRARLPEYMLPSAFVVLESLPVTPNGKTDRAALPAPDTAGAGEGRQVAPRTPAEERMAAVWAEVLGTERVGVEDNFFELGGHSLLATQVASRVRETFRVELPLRAVFEAPTVAELARRVERLRWDAVPAAELPPLVPVSREARSALPLSFAQQRLWFIDQLEPGSPAYNLPLPLRLRGPLDARVLARTLGEVVRRHEALRTVFDAAGAEPVQVVRPAAPVPLPAADLSALAEDAREAEARRIVVDDARRPFDLRRGPLLYARLLRLAPEDHVLAVAMHHVVSDGWSVGVLFREMAALYDAFARGAPSPLPELPVQYADFAVWQRAWLTGDALERQLAWWRERLAGAPAVLEIPTDRPRRPAPDSRAALVARTLPREAADRVRALARGEGATLYMVLLAALDVLLARWSGGDDVVVGTPIANRTRRETEGLIGFFVNTLALRADLSGDPTFREVLERLRESTLGAYQHQDLPFERLVEELGVERSLAHTPLFQVVFAVDDGGGTPRPLGPVRVEHYEAGGDAAKFDLSVAVADTGAELDVAFTFRAELWDAATLERVLDAYLLLLDAAAADPARRVAALPLVTEAERARLLGEWSGGTLPEPDHRGIHELFAAQARRSPDAVAVADRGSVLTYAALADRAGALARRLRALGVGPDVRVGICAERGAPTVAAMLAVAAAGGAYVPLDPEYPAERLAFMLADAGVRVLLSDGAAGDRLADFAGEVVALEAPSPPDPLSPASGRKGENDGLEDADALSHSRTFALSHSPSSLACVIYTSGSTGRPKGVAVTHRGIVRLVRGADFVRIGPDDRVAQASNPVFDAATWEVWGPLLNGGRVVCMDRDTALDARGLAAALREEGVTALFLTTALFNQAVREVPDAFAGVRDVLFGGEAADPAAVRACLAGGPPRRLLHVYGPTENTTFSSWQTVKSVAEDAATVAIGRAVAGSTVYVLDAEMEPVPAGWPGELYVGGHGLARGYLGRPESTAAAFVPHPFSREAGARLYRTGDRVRWSAAGEIEFLGRADQQAKIRGFRIEPGEVEAALLDHPEVREAAVLVREDSPGERRLAAYVVARGDAPPGAEALRAHLRRTLPDYMVPAAFVVLDRLPLTATGKVDRRALPAPELAGGAGVDDAPRTPTEALLAALCAGVLGVERVGARDDFFALGGHSLLATRVVARVRESFGVELPLRALFEAPTVAGLAERVDALLGSGAARHAPPLARAPRIPGRPLPLSFAQQRLWLVEQVDPGTAAYTLPVPLRLRGPLDPAALGRALDGIVRRHEALRTTFTAVGGEPGQVVHPAARGVLAIVELSGLAPAAAEAEARRLADAAMLRPFDLERGPLFRAVLARTAPDDAALLLAMHHAVADGWSLGVLLRELSALYGAYRAGEPSPLPELPFQYADFAAWQRGWLAGEVLERQVAWWREHLAGAPPLLELPTDRPRSAVRGARGGARAFRLPAAAARALRELSAREGATLFMTVLAGWQALLARWSGQDDVVVGSPIAGRTHLELEGLIGFFVNTLPLRTDLAGDPAFAALLRRVRETTLGTYAHQDVPFERLVEELGVERSLTHTPLFQAVLSLQNLGPLEHPLGDVRTEPLETEALTARFDLTLALAEEGEEIAGGATFRADLWDGATVERMLEGLARVLEQAAADPSRPLSSLELLGSAERARVLEAWNDTAAEVPPGPVHERIAAQAARTPHAPAVVFGDETITFAGLMARAGDLARRLRESGVGPDARVGLFLERGPGLVVGVLGILQAGGAYVALDPSHPDERLLFMLRDAGAAAVVTDDALAARIAGFGGAVVGLAPSPPGPLSPASGRKGENDNDTPEVEDRQRGDSPLPERGRVASLSEPGGGPADAPVPVHPDNLAYVVYTSGSTGTPKGVLVTHRGLANYLAFFDREVLGDDGFALPLVSRLSFDAHVRQLFPPLLRGEPVWVLPEDAVADPVALLDALGSRGRVSFGGVPSLWGAVMDAIDAGERPAPHDLRAVLLGGEALPAELVRRTRERFPGARIWNHYGPTEATVNTTVARVEDAERITLGRPVANTRVYLLDAHGSPVPTGVAGELHVGGAGVSRGYLGRPELTAEKFVPDPFAGEPRSGARMYRSGDRARWLPAGELEYLGRTDQQVKVRGFRVEPGEIEAVLRRHPSVRDAVVDAREDGRGGLRLVGYVVAAEDAAVSAAELRAWAGGRLPEYMVPAAWAVLERVPLTPNGKVDRRALPEPDASADAGARAALTPTQEILAGIWGEYLAVEDVGPDSDFFALGGHSLTATGMISRVRAAFGVEVPLRAVFEGPRLARLAERIDALLEDGAGAVLPPLARAPRAGPLPLSFAQQRLWFIEQMDPDARLYVLAFAYRLRGALDVRALRRAVGETVRRHEVLRTRFEEAGGEPVQVVDPPAPVPLPVVDLRSLGAAEAERRAARLAEAEVRHRFDLRAGPLLRTTLLRMADDDWALLLTVHHIVFDGWSTGVFNVEVSELYGAYAAGREPDLPEPAFQYADYAAWQREWLAGDVLAAQLAWWRERLAGAPPLLEPPTDFPRPPVPGAAAARVYFDVPEEATRRLYALARREGSTLFMALLAAWQLLLARWSGRDDVVTGAPIAGRRRTEVEPMVGFFVNTLALRTDVGGDPTFGELLRRVREATLGAYQHQDVPFERLVEELGVRRSLSHAPVFQNLFAVQNHERLAMRLEGLRLEPFPTEADAARADLALTLVEGGDRLLGMLTFRVELWEAATMQRLLGRFMRLLEEVGAAPERRVSALPLVDDAERAHLLSELGGAPGEVPRRCIHELFAEQAARTPDAPAVVFGPDALSYAELDRRSGALAATLRERGVGPEARVGLCAERSAALVVAMLAVLRAGGAYVPLDPSYPAARLAYVLADAGVRVLLTDGSAGDRLADFRGEVVALDTPHPPAPSPTRGEGENDGSGGETAVAGCSVFPVPCSLSLACVVYTSGSTGAPKGVAVPHRGVVRLVRGADFVRLGPGDRVAQLSNPAFDAATWEIWGALLNGGCVVGIDRDTSLDPRRLADALRAGGVTALFLTTALFGQAVREAPDTFAGVRHVLFGGEAVDPAAVRACLAGGAPGRLLHVYGPTENTTFSSWHVVEKVAEGAPTVPIGRAVAGSTAYVLDPAMEPAPQGWPGELYLGGHGLARGYLDHPEATAERFVPDPFSGGAGARMYRTGDRARWSPAGAVEFIGRTDQQVKIRGFRIEPGEVEAALLEHPALADAVVAVREDVPGERRLVAYVVPREGAFVDVEALRQGLRRKLPDYMVPGALVALETLPLTATGKTDRAALPAPDPAGAAGEFVAPRTPVEEMLAGIWAEVLGVGRVGAGDDFFDLGGHSLLATRVTSRVQAACGVELSVRALFDAPTLERFAERVEAVLQAEIEEWEMEEELKRLEGLSDEDIARLLGGFQT